MHIYACAGQYTYINAGKCTYTRCNPCICLAHARTHTSQSWIEAGHYDRAVGSVPAHKQCAEDVELVFNNAMVCLLLQSCVCVRAHVPKIA